MIKYTRELEDKIRIGRVREWCAGAGKIDLAQLTTMVPCPESQSQKRNQDSKPGHQSTICKIQRHLGLPGSAILKVVSLVSRLLDRDTLVDAHQYKS